MTFKQAKELTGSKKAASALLKGEKPEIKQLERTAFGVLKKGLFLGGECLAVYWNDEPAAYRAFKAYAAKLGALL